jgi:hypothetical protein
MKDKKKYGDNEIKDKEEKNEANIKLKEETLKNNYLKKAIKDIQNKMKKIQVNNSNLIKHKSSGKIKSPKIISPKRRISSKANELTVTKFTESKGNYSSNMF